MKRDAEFHTFVMEDVLGDIPEVASRAMFSGYGIYKDGVIFAIIAEGQLYFKVDEKTEGQYKKYGSSPFTYEMPNGKKMSMSYWLLPEEIMENREELQDWVYEALAASKRGKAKKKRR